MSEKKIALWSFFVGVISVIVAIFLPEIRANLSLDEDNTPDIFLKDTSSYNDYVSDRDGNEYNVVKFNDRYWTGANLKVKIGGAVCYEHKIVNCDKLGRLYTIEEAKIACKSLEGNWEIPSFEEWKELLIIHGADFLSNGEVGYHHMGTRFRNPEAVYYNLINDSIDIQSRAISRINLQLGGDLVKGKFTSMELRGNFWTNQIHNDYSLMFVTVLRLSAASKWFDTKVPSAYFTTEITNTEENPRFSCRCIRVNETH